MTPDMMQEKNAVFLLKCNVTTLYGVLLKLKLFMWRYLWEVFSPLERISRFYPVSGQQLSLNPESNDEILQWNINVQNCLNPCYFVTISDIFKRPVQRSEDITHFDLHREMILTLNARYALVCQNPGLCTAVDYTCICIVISMFTWTRWLGVHLCVKVPECQI